MEFWNARNMLAPPTYTYEANADDIDINHFKSILQDGISFYNDQSLLNVEVALLSRIVYRMKKKFRNSKDFQTLEKVKKDVCIFEGMNISQKLEYLLSIFPNSDYFDVVVSLPTKNMIDFILVQLQGIGKILCRAIETCKQTVIIYEHRLYLGHFWKLALIAIALVSRIHILCLNILKFTCLLYLRLLPFSHKLKNVTTNWLPKEYIFPKDLKTWLNVEWCKLEEVIEIPDEFNLSLINLVEDSDDEVEFIEINDVTEIIEDFRKIRRSQIKKLDFDSVGTFTSKHTADIGEEIVIHEENDVENEELGKKTVYNTNEMSFLKKDREANSERTINEEDISSSEDDLCNKSPMHMQPRIYQVDISQDISSSKEISLKQRLQKVNEVDIGEVISSDDDIFKKRTTEVSASYLIQKENSVKGKSFPVIISSSENEDENTSVQFVAETFMSRKPCVTSDFIPLNSSNPSLIRNVRPVKFQGLKGPKKLKNKRKKSKDLSVVVIPDSPNNSECQNSVVTQKGFKRKSFDENNDSGRNRGSTKKKRK